MRIVIIGAGNAGSQLAQRLCEERHSVVMVDADPQALAQAEAGLDLLTICGKGTNPVVLEEAQVDKSDLLIAVTDSGTGMPPQVLERALTPFFTTKDKGKGTGLGLSMVYGYVKQSGGHFKIYSEESIGTTLKLYLPRSTAPEGVDTSNSGGSALNQGGNQLILVVEDEESVLSLTRSLLRHTDAGP